MMNKRPSFKKSAVLLAVLGSISSVPALADSNTGFLEGSSTNLNFRYRYENVDQQGIKEQADASTLRSRLTFKSGTFSNYRVLAEVDNVTRIGAERYNSGNNHDNVKGYPVVADPTGTDLNQLNVMYQGENGAFTLGRQRINLGNQRFVGGVAWRQNEQTFDGARGQYTFNDNFSLDYSFVYHVNRIFGPDGPKSSLNGYFHFINATYKQSEMLNVTAFAYLLNDNDWPDQNNTIGFDYTGKFGWLSAHASYAKQEYRDFDAGYFAIDGTASVSAFKFTLGMEELGDDHGQYGFSTPLATAHKFNGFADKFLATPKDGLRDYYGKVATKVGPVNLAAFYHKFESVNNKRDYGTEYDLVASAKVHKTTTVLVKYASYDADTTSASDKGLTADTDKLWLMANVNFNL
ncbi:alginate export family protein [Parashewanella tropica]|uniref:alginate export family protein n=1 Tax=Parashewanella tropica TaxID=2547970 RepID=UPI001059DCA0|nr:alginate export family protein [Parashewanella tropica]